MADESSSGGTVWHDTLPVPLADPNWNPGKIFIAINFKAPEQVGRHVFHCHIPEHEDKGTMAPIEVLRAGQ
jgi:FtsP/CotA-like multicopper oxidase with cupredoxin domain